MSATVFTNVLIWTPGQAARPGAVLVEEGRISTVADGAEPLAAVGAELVDGQGATLMPGLIDGHAHLPFPELADTNAFALIPAEEHVLITMHNARRVLDAGFTAVLSGGSVKPRLDAVIRDEIAAGRIPGPRILASTPEFTVTGGLGDDSRMHLDLQTFCLTMDGADAFRRNARLFLREGSDVIKVCVSGHQPVPGCRHGPAEATLVTDAELAAVTETTKALGKLAAAHARSDTAVAMCLRHGVDILYHCEYVTEATMDLLEAAKDRVTLAPALAPFVRSIELLEDQGKAVPAALRDQFARVCETYAALRKRGLRVMIGGEYGLAHCPHGANARDIEYFVRFLGYAPAEALACATLNGAAGMGLDDRLGRIAPGFEADLLLVDGKPFEDPAILQDAGKLRLIMQGGRIHKQDLCSPATGGQAGA